MDAGEKVKKEFTGFEGRIKGDFKEVENIRIDSFITVIFKNAGLNDGFRVKYDLRTLIDK